MDIVIGSNGYEIFSMTMDYKLDMDFDYGKWILVDQMVIGLKIWIMKWSLKKNTISKIKDSPKVKWELTLKIQHLFEVQNQIAKINLIKNQLD